MMNLPIVYVKKGRDERVRAGHLWIFSNELEEGFQQTEPGSLVEVRNAQDRLIGMGTINPRSLLTVRLLSRELEELSREWLRVRIETAWAVRQRLLSPQVSACRVVYSEADGLPGLMIDKFGDVLSLQTLTAGMDRLLPLLVDILVELFSPRAICAANDATVRAWEGLPEERKLIYGTLDGLHTFEQDNISFVVDILNGQKTGFFCDQRFNRLRFASIIRNGDRVLDLFSFTGGFGLYALQAGAAHVTFVDGSQRALDLAKQACAQNGWSARTAFVKADIFDWIKSPTESWDAVSVDPPALAKSRDKATAALRGYRDLNARALAWVRPGGIFATSSCSGLISPVNWRSTIDEAAYKSRRRVRYIHFAGQAPDHPILPAMPETEYLKFALAIVDDRRP